MGVEPWGRQSQNVLGDHPPEKSSNLSTLTSAVVDAAHKLVVGFREEILVEAVHRVYTDGAHDLQAIKTVVGETAHLIKEVRRGRNNGFMGGSSHDTNNAEDKEHGIGYCSSGQDEIGAFLFSLSLLYGALPGYHHRVWKSLRNCSTATRTLSNAVQDLVHLAAIVWEGNDSPNLGGEDAIDVDCGGPHDGNSRRMNLAQDGCVCVFPWNPVIQVLSWGVIPILTAENLFLSCIQAAANPEPFEEGLGYHEGKGSQKRDGMLAVVAAVAKGYHSLGVGQDLSTVSLVDLCCVAARASNVAKPSGYHPMDLCRLIGRLILP